MSSDVLARSLARLDVAELTRLLARRPDAVRGVGPRDLDETAQRLWHPYGLSEAITALPLPAIQLLEAAAALGERSMMSQLTSLLASSADDVGRWADELAAVAVVVRDGDSLYLPTQLRTIIPDPLGIGQPLAELLERVTVDILRHMQRSLCLPAGRTRADVLAGLLAFYADPERLGAAIASVPPAIRAHLRDERRDDDNATTRGDARRSADLDDYFDYLESGYLDPYGVDPDDLDPEVFYDLGFDSRAAYQARAGRSKAMAALADRGLAVPGRWGYGAQLPAEVAWALRGPDYHPQFDPRPPPVAVLNVDTAALERQAAGSAATFSAAALAVLDRLAREPIPLLKSGGVGARELSRLVKAVAVDGMTIRLVLELAAEAELLDGAGTLLQMSRRWPAWRAAEPSLQLVDLIRSWWNLGRTPTDSLDQDGKATRALTSSAQCASCRRARHVLIAAVAEAGPVELPAAARRAIWHAPLCHPAYADGATPLRTVRDEANLLGVLAGGSITALGTALLAGSELDGVARELLPASSDHAVFGSDLTAYTAGTPGARVVAILDSAAERESSGGAVTWRFSPASVRRAFDAGTDLDTLTGALESIAAAGLSQPLRYLLGDVSRRHGQLRLSAAKIAISSDDVALLAEVAAHRAVARYRPRLLAPTVLVADAELAVLLETLRKAGYFPVVDLTSASDPSSETVRAGSSGGSATGSVRSLPTSVPRRTDAPDPSALAAALVAAGRPGKVPTGRRGNQQLF